MIFYGLSSNVIKISACLASPLNYYRKNYKINILSKKYEQLFEHYDYFEIQPHINCEEQKEYNKFLYDMSLKYNKPLIAGTDTHSLNKYKAECRDILKKSKKIEFNNEDEFDLTYKSYEELIDMFKKQNSLPKDVYMTAINNTNIMADSVTDFELDISFKYPKVENEKDALIKLLQEKYQDKVKRGVIKDNPKYWEQMNEEIRVFEIVGMLGFMYMMSDIMTYCRNNGIPFSPCRGSVGGSTVAYISDITDVDPIVWNTVFSRFCNEDRKEIGDIDIDISPDQRELVYNYIINKYGKEYTSYILATGTISEKGTIDTIGRALNISLKEVEKIKNEYSKNAEKTREKYKDLFYYFDGLVNTVISQSIHPAGIIVSPINLVDNYGTFWNDGKRILNINMEEVHEVSLVKYDVLGLKNIQILRNCCELIGVSFPTSDKINWNDEKVWQDVLCSPVGLFQFESPFAFESLKKFCPHKINDLSLVNAAIRPSGASYRDDLLAHKTKTNPSKIIDELLKDNNGFLCFQEDTIKFLQNICGLTGSEADNIRRAIGRKQKDRLEKALPQILRGYCDNSPQPKEIAEKEAKEFLQIIEDSSNYQFGQNHSTGYSMVGFLCAYYRYYYPIEFVTSYLNNADTEEDIQRGTELAKVKKIKIRPIKFGKSRAQYFMDKSTNSIYKGIGSIKYLNDSCAEELYNIAQTRYDNFMQLLFATNNIGINSRQLDILIKLDFFSDFGNVNELLEMVTIFNKLKNGTAKTLTKGKLENPQVERIVANYSNDRGKNGNILKSYTILNMSKILDEINDFVKALKIPDMTLQEKIQVQQEYLGYISNTGKEEDRKSLLVKDIFPLNRKKDNVQFGYSIITQSLGSGVQARFTIFNETYNSCGKIKKGSLIRCEEYYSKNNFFTLKKYKIL